MEVTGAENLGNVKKFLDSFKVLHSVGESKNHFEPEGYSCNN